MTNDGPRQPDCSHIKWLRWQGTITHMTDLRTLHLSCELLGVDCDCCTFGKNEKW